MLWFTMTMTSTFWLVKRRSTCHQKLFQLFIRLEHNYDEDGKRASVDGDDDVKWNVYNVQGCSNYGIIYACQRTGANRMRKVHNNNLCGKRTHKFLLKKYSLFKLVSMALLGLYALCILGCSLQNSVELYPNDFMPSRLYVCYVYMCIYVV